MQNSVINICSFIEKSVSFGEKIRAVVEVKKEYKVFWKLGFKERFFV